MTGVTRRKGIALEALEAARGVRLCPGCLADHFRSYPERPDVTCLKLWCECWCNQGMGN